MFQIPDTWAGSQSTFEQVLEAAASAHQLTETRAAAGKASDPYEMPALLDVQDGVAIVSMRGPMIPGSAGFMRLFGVVGYGDIHQALVEGAARKDVKSVILDVSSQGGAVEGVDELSQAISDIGTMKPIVAFAGGDMASAAYWAASAAKRRYASKTSTVGSLGVVSVYMERSKQLARDGVGVTVTRSGKWKGNMMGLEPLTDAARADIQDRVDTLNAIFEERVAANLKMPVKVVHDKMGQGRVFIGMKAYEVGLIDGVSSFQDAFNVAKILGNA